MPFGDYSLSDPFGVADPFRALDQSAGGDALTRIPRMPATPEAIDQAAEELGIGSRLLQGAGWVGSSLDKLFGARAARAAIDALAGGGGGRDILNIIPFSDTLGITDPGQAVGGAKLLRDVIGYDPEQGTWAERNLVGPAVEMALDPTTYLGGIGALTKAGKAAAKMGEVTKGLLPAVAAGERSLIYGLRGPAVAGAAERALEGAGAVNDLLRRIPGMAATQDVLGEAGKQARLGLGALFDPLAGNTSNEALQEISRSVRFPEQAARQRDVLGRAASLWEQMGQAVPAGTDATGVGRYIQDLLEQRMAGKGLLPGMAEQLPVSQAALQSVEALGPEVRRNVETIADELARHYDELNKARQAVGLKPMEVASYADRPDLLAVNPIQEFVAAGRRGAEEFGKAAALREVASRYGVPAAELEGGRALGDVAGQIRLGGTVGDALKANVIPADLARALVKQSEGWIPEAAKPLADLWDKYQNLFKAGIYSLWPGGQVKNLISGEFESLMGQPGLLTGKVPFGSGSREIAGLLRRGPQSPEEMDLLKSAFERGVISGPQGEFSDLLGQRFADVTQNPFRAVAPAGVLPAAGEFLAGAVREPGGLNPLSAEKFAGYRAGRQLGANIEDYLRLSQFDDLIKKGYTPDAAAELVKKTQLDYESMSDFERQVMKRIAPFYTFTRKNVPKQIERALTEPAKSLMLTRPFGQSGENYVPGQLAGGIAVPLGGTDAEGNQRYLSGLGLPFEEAYGRIQGGTSTPDMFWNSVRGLLASTNPLIKGAIENATGVSLSTGRELEASQPNRVLAAAVGPGAAGPLTQLLAATPLARVMSTANMLADPRKGAMADLVNLGTGARITDASVEQGRSREIGRMIDELLAGQPLVRQSENYYIRPEDLPNVDPETIKLMMLRNARMAAARRVGVRNP